MLNARIRPVLQTTKSHNLKLELSKCEFNVADLEYFRYQFIEKGVIPTEEKVLAITQMRAPTNVEELRAYLGLLKKEVPFVWTQECDEVMRGWTR
jgi:hypothetical protein